MASREFESSSQSLANGACSQTVSLENTRESLAQMTATIHRNTTDATFADELMQSTNAIEDSAREKMEVLTRSIEHITAASEKTQKIVKTIDEIAFQTNLLALNAAVEAARETAALIRETSVQIQDGATVVSQAQETFKEVIASATQVGLLLRGISETSLTQANDVERVNLEVEQMSRVVHHNASAAEESASASELLRQQAFKMQQMLGNMAVLVGGKGVEKRLVEPKINGTDPSLKSITIPAPVPRNVSVVRKPSLFKSPASVYDSSFYPTDIPAREKKEEFLKAG